MIDGSEKRNRRLAFELQNSHVCEKRSKLNTHEAFLCVGERILVTRAQPHIPEI